MTGRATRPLFAMIMGGSLAWSGIALADNQAAHEMAQKFAAGAEQEDAKKKAAEAERKAEKAKRKANIEKQRAAEEAEMLRQARAEAAERKAAADKARADEEAVEARLEQERVAAEQRKVEEAAEQLKLQEEKRIAEQKHADEKQRLAEEQRVAAEQRKAKEAAEQRRIAEAELQQKLEEDRRVAEEKRLAEHQKALVAEREAEHKRLTERLTRLNEKRDAQKRLAAEAPRMGLGAARKHEAAPQTVSEPSAKAAPTTRVTVLLVMESGTNGIRRYGKKTADPVICSGAICWVSTGNDRSATAMNRGTALGPGNTLGRRAAACNQHLSCIYRDVDLKALSASVQPIDLRIMRHDRREPLSLEADSSCRLSASGALMCDRTFSTRSWRAWVVPEALAKQATPVALETAIDTRLAVKPSAALETRPRP